MFPGFPIGTIVPIRTADYNSTNFWLNETKQPETQYLQNRDGSGKKGTQYEGWYICNGETWKKGAISYTLPNLNSYQYDIEADSSGNSDQGAETSQAVKRSMLGGADIRLTITHDGTNFISSYVKWQQANEVEIFNSQSGSLSEQNPGLIYLCYLKEADLTWETDGFVAPSLYDLYLGLGRTSIAACSASANLYKVDFDPNSISWTNLQQSLSGYNLYNSTGTQLAVANYYSNGGVTRYWNGSSFAQVVQCTSLTAVTAYYAANMYNLNGSSTPYLNSTQSTIYISGDSNFSIGAAIYTNSNGTGNPATGWYRVGNVRRYWSNAESEFIGSSITVDEIKNLMDGSYDGLGNLGIIANSQINACSGNGYYSYLYTTDGTFMSAGSINGVYLNLYNPATNEGEEPLQQIEYGNYVSDYEGFSRFCGSIGTLNAKQHCPPQTL
jgi:hypothetical protein